MVSCVNLQLSQRLSEDALLAMFSAKGTAFPILFPKPNPFLSSWRNPPLAGAENYRKTLEKLSLCDDIAIVMFAFVFLVCSEKSKDQCVCLRLSEVRLIHHLNIEEPPFTP
jgi:hypothetical protein